MSNFDGYGKFISEDGAMLELGLFVRKDAQIPEFDVVKEINLESSFSGEIEEMNQKVVALACDLGGMFIEDAMKLSETDFPTKLELIPALRALKNAILDYLEKSGQAERYRRYTDKIVCRCYNLSEREIADELTKGIKTSAGTSCGSCIRKVQEIMGKVQGV